MEPLPSNTTLTHYQDTSKLNRKVALKIFVSPYLLATVHLALGEKQRAIELLEQAYSEHSVDIVKAKIDPQLNQLRTEPRFQTLVKKVGFPQ